jgi:peptidoglycan/LPS O-acetylase OafA/YrhL
MMTHEQYLATKRFPALDGLRAIAALLVVVYHYGGPNWAMANGWIGVHLFFVLSGFLITTLALREEDRNGKISLADFYIRRAFRILPVYFAVLGIVVAFTYLRGKYSASGLSDAMPYFLTFTNEFAATAPFGQSWTLGIEQKFYLVWPFLAFGIAALSFPKRLGLAIGLIALMIALIPVMPYAGAYSPIIIGCALAIGLHYRKGFAVLRVFTHPIAGFVLLTALVVVQTHVTDIEAFLQDGGTVGGTTYAVLVALFIISLIPRGPIAWLFSTPPMRFIGERSYSVYLLQGVAASVVALSIPQLGVHRTLTALVVTVVALIVSDVLYRWVEVPMIDVGRKVVAWRKTRADGRDKPEQANPTLREAEPVLASG